jgi:hypothetical protein
MGCELRDTLALQYLEAQDMQRRAARGLVQAVTLTNIECAKTELRRVEAYRQDIVRELVSHCESHACGTEELEGICGISLSSRMVA